MLKVLAIGLGVLAAAITFAPPASANVVYAICSSPCDATSLPGAANLMFTGTISFTTTALNPDANGAYTDPTTGTIFSAFNMTGSDPQASIYNSGYLQGNNGSGSGINITLPQNTYAFSLELSTYNTGAFGITVGGYPVNIPNGSAIYFAEISDSSPLGSLVINSTGTDGRLLVDSFSEGFTPEPSTFTLMGGGLIAGALMLLRRHRQTTPPEHPPR